MRYHPRVIPLLLLEADRLVKTTKFRSPSYVGDPINAIKVFNEKYCDELILLDIGSSKRNTPINFNLIEECASQCMMPLSYGGGIKTIEDARTLFSIGVEKIVLQSSVCHDPSFTSALVDVFGSQSICVSLDIRKSRLGGYKLLNKVKGLRSSAWIKVANRFESLGAGEILINYVDHDGTQLGLNHDLIVQASSKLGLPLIAAGGTSSLNDVQRGLSNGASAIAVGSLFVHYGPHKAVLISYPSESCLSSLGDSVQSSSH
tara:strand:+ start:2188 stop:2967 length:780 start_codon:yes stop_codon:yes gene_type:complete